MLAILFSTLVSLSLAQNTVGNGLHSGHGKKVISAVEEKSLEDLKKKAKVSFVEPKDGATVSTKFKVKVAVSGMKLKQAGTDVDDVTAGHVHILVDEGPATAGLPIPMSETHIHFLTGKDESEITLKPGKHKLTVQMADGAHRSLGASVSQTIQITVKEKQ